MAPKLHTLKLGSRNASLPKNCSQNNKLDTIDEMIDLEDGGGEDDKIFKQH